MMVDDRKKIMRLIEKSNKNLIPVEQILRSRLKKISAFRDSLNRIYSEMGELKHKRDKLFKEESNLVAERGAMVLYSQKHKEKF